MRPVGDIISDSPPEHKKGIKFAEGTKLTSSTSETSLSSRGYAKKHTLGDGIGVNYNKQQSSGSSFAGFNPMAATHGEEGEVRRSEEGRRGRAKRQLELHLTCLPLASLALPVLVASLLALSSQVNPMHQGKGRGLSKAIVNQQMSSVSLGSDSFASNCQPGSSSSSSEDEDEENMPKRSNSWDFDPFPTRFKKSTSKMYSRGGHAGVEMVDLENGEPRRKKKKKRRRKRR